MSVKYRTFARQFVQRTPAEIVAAVSLALCVGFAATLGMIGYDIVWKPLPFRDSDTLVVIAQANRDRTGRSPVSIPTIERWGKSPELEAISSYRPTQLTQIRAGIADRVSAVEVTGDFFRILGAQFSGGRGFDEADVQQAADLLPVVVSNSFWTRFRGAEAFAPSMIRFDDRDYWIVGTTNTRFPRGVDIWMPLPSNSPERIDDQTSEFEALGRLRHSRIPESFVSDLSATLPQPKAGGPVRVTVQTIYDVLTSASRPALRLLLAAVLAMVVFAALTVAALFLADQERRQRDTAIKKALGASGRQLGMDAWLHALGFGLFVSVVGGIFALVLFSPVVRMIEPLGWPRLDEVHADVTLLAVLVIVAIPITLLSVGPVLVGNRTLALQRLLADNASRLGVGHRSNRAMAALLVLEIAAAVCLVAGSISAFARLRTVVRADVGASTDEHVVAIRLSQLTFDWSQSARWTQGALDDLERVRRMPTVSLASAATTLPLRADNISATVTVDQRPSSKGPRLQFRTIGPDYFGVLGIPILEGRACSRDDSPARAPVVMINKAASDLLFGGGHAMGHVIAYQSEIGREVVGIVGDVRDLGPGETARPTVYSCIAQDRKTAVWIVAKTSAEPQLVLREIARDLKTNDAGSVVTSTTTMAEVYDHLVRNPRLSASAFAAFVTVVMTLSLLGVYSLASYSVMVQEHELALRTALGAPRHRLFVRQYWAVSQLLVAGVVIGVFASVPLQNVARSYGFDFASGIMTFIAATGIVSVGSYSAVTIACRRAFAPGVIVKLK